MDASLAAAVLACDYRGGMENTNTGTYEPTDKPVLLSPVELETIAASLPAGATVLGGIGGSTASDLEHGAVVPAAAGSVIVIYALDDHTIHSVVMTEVKSGHYELTDDHVVGAW